ncbi:YeeE/YedE family protein, partial [Lutibacter sp. HS1-25]
ILGMIMMTFFRRKVIKTFEGKDIIVPPKKPGIYRNLFGGILFGLGWGLAGACPGPMFVLLGQGVVAILVVIFGATFGAFLYGVFKEKLPH